ncbi:cerebellar degeneration-related protein 2 [Aplochiton taeniatus]
MLTDRIVDEEFEMKDDDWYDQQDLERDLHLAAELGKTLLDRNHELEQGLHQMYSTNQDQLQEIEYLAKQVEHLRQMNDQHAKVYEQLDQAARELEQGNHGLVQDNRMAQQRIHSLTETVDGLQRHVDDLQTQVEELNMAQAERSKRELAEQRRSLGAQSVSCIKELYDLHNDRLISHDSLRLDRPWPAQSSICDRGPDPEEEHRALQRSVKALQGKLTAERRRREAAQQETELVSTENGVLEQRLAHLEGCRARQRELEAEVEELRQLWRANYTNRRPEQMLLLDDVFFPPKKPGAGQSEEGERPDKEKEQERCSSESALRLANAEDVLRGHERTCIRRSEAVKQRGISLLNEVDAQYSALQVKYEELLRRCQQGADGLSHKAIQTAHSPQAGQRGRRRSSLALSSLSVVLEDGQQQPQQQPEYKALFQEIFTCIQKTKEDLSENQRTPQGL